MSARWYVGGSLVVAALAAGATVVFPMGMGTTVIVGLVIGAIVAEAVLWLN
jgi:hypothetical protein